MNLLFISSLFLLCEISLAEEGPPAPVEFAKRMISTLPDLPGAIAGGLEGKADGIKSMISSVLGDGLISQLVVNPIGMAEEVLPDLGLNKTDVLNNLSGGTKNNGSQFSNSLFGKNTGFLSMFTTTAKPTTTEVMLIDGVPVKDFDEYIRKNHLENTFSTKRPPPSTTAAPTADELVDRIANRIKSDMVVPPANNLNNYPRHPDDFTSTLNMANIDPKRIGEVNTLLRRAPQHFDAGAMDVFGNPPGFIQSPPTPAPLDPTINEVITDMRTRGVDGLSTQDIKRLKDILNTYEATLQTKEFISKRNQLQVLQTELEEQKKRIDMQRKMEAELHKKAKEIEERKAKMEAQLREQLHSWNLSHLVDNGPKGTSNLMDLPELNPSAFPQLVESGNGGSPPAFMMEGDVKMGTTERTTEETTTTTTTTTEMPMPPSTIPSRVIPRAMRTNGNIRFSPPNRVPSSTAIKKDIEYPTACACQEIYASDLRGKWIPALASKSMLSNVYERISDLLHTDAPSSLSCSRFNVGQSRKTKNGGEARVAWEFEMNGDATVHRMTGTASARDRKTVNINLQKVDGERLDFPLCILKADPRYTYFVAVNPQGPCDQATLMVRDPDDFFNRENNDLVAYLKQKVASGELEKLEMLSFARDCSN